MTSIKLCGEFVDVNLMNHEEMISKFKSYCAMENGKMYVDRDALQERAREGLEREKNLRENGIRTYPVRLDDILEEFLRELKKETA